MDNGTFQYYENSGYKNLRNKKKTLILDITDNTALSSGSEFNIKLFEPLKIDKQSELYLDNFITFNSMLADNSERSSFCLKINEFNINTNCAADDVSQNALYNSVIIPNENRNIDNFFTSVSHKAKKFNYICDVNPMTISSLSGKITDLEGNSVFHGDSDSSNGEKTYALMNITSPWEDSSGVVLGEQVKTLIPSGTEFTLAQGGGNTVSCLTIAAFSKDSSNLYFASNDNSEITIDNYNNKDNVVVTVTNTQLGKVHISMGGADFTFRTNYPTLLSEGGRIIAEFSIVSRE
jgi:hypothetical protein